jgi:NAD(P)-dependent dehydrogenase (short-subunit alcohol dehydrogenase family)
MKKNWTIKDIPDLSGKVYIVTGANVGLGFESSIALAKKGTTVIMACRNMEKGKKALTDIKREVPNAKIELMQLDLASLKSVHAFSEEFRQNYDRLDVLMNNAGVMACPYGKTEDGFEKQFGTNHLGHFALTGLLIDFIIKTTGSRVVNTSSMGHTIGRMDWDNIMYENGGYRASWAYGRSKLANLLFTYELDRRLKQSGHHCGALAAHPGSSETDLARHVEGQLFFRLISLLFRSQSAAQGALPQLRAAVDPKAKSGEYYGPHKGGRGYPIKVESNGRSYNKKDARKLWEMSEKLTNVTFDF